MCKNIFIYRIKNIIFYKMVNKCTEVLTKGSNKGKVCNQVDAIIPCSNASHRKNRKKRNNNATIQQTTNIDTKKCNVITSSSDSINNNLEADKTVIESYIVEFLKLPGIDIESARELALKRIEIDKQKMEEIKKLNEKKKLEFMNTCKIEQANKLKAINDGPKMPRDSMKFYQALRNKFPGTDKFPDAGIKDYMDDVILPMGFKGVIKLLDNVLRDENGKYPFILYNDKEVEWVRDLDQQLFEKLNTNGIKDRNEKGDAIKIKYIPYNYNSDEDKSIYPDDETFYDKYTDSMRDELTGIKIVADTSQDYDEFRNLLMQFIRKTYHEYVYPIEKHAIDKFIRKKPVLENIDNLPLWKFNRKVIKFNEEWEKNVGYRNYADDCNPLYDLNGLFSTNTNYKIAKSILKELEPQFKKNGNNDKKSLKILFDKKTLKQIEKKTTELKSLYTDPESYLSKGVQLSDEEFKQMAMMQLQKDRMMDDEYKFDLLSSMTDNSAVNKYMNNIIKVFRAMFPNCRAD